MEVSPSSAAFPRHGTTYYTSTTRTTYRPVDSQLLIRPASGLSNTTNQVGRCGPGRDLPGHYQSIQRQSYVPLVSSSFLFNNNNNNNNCSNTNSNNNSPSRPTSAFSTASRQVHQQLNQTRPGTARSCSGAADPRVSSFSRPGSASATDTFGKNSFSGSTSSSRKEAVVFAESQHAPHIYMSTAPDIFKNLRKYGTTTTTTTTRPHTARK